LCCLPKILFGAYYEQTWGEEEKLTVEVNPLAFPFCLNACLLYLGAAAWINPSWFTSGM